VGSIYPLFVSGIPQERVSNSSLNVVEENKIISTEKFIQQTPNTMYILVADLYEYAASLGQKL
jgi:hypothetical protein